MDAKNSTHHSTAPSDRQQVLPLLNSTPVSSATWASSIQNSDSRHSLALAPASDTSLGSPAVQDSSHALSFVDESTRHNVTQSSERNNQDVGKNAVTKSRKPRKPSNASGGRSTLFWVHSDPQSAAQGTREETLKRIRSHVMSEHNRKKRLENTKRYKSKTWKHLAFQPPETAASSSAASTPLASAPGDSQEVPLKVSQSEQQGASLENALAGDAPGFVAALTENYHDVDASSHSQSLAVVQDHSPLAYLGPGGNDPFNVFHTRLTDRMARHLQYFLGTLTHIAYPLQRRYGDKLQAHWTALVHCDPASLHACICVAASNRALTVGEFPVKEGQRPSALLLDTFHHRGETIRLVNEGLSDPVKASSDSLIAAVSTLLTIEIASGNPDYLKIHLAGLRQMVALRNSLADVPPDIRFQISWTDIRVACMAFTKPIFPFLRYARPDFTVSPHNEDLAKTASALNSLIEIPSILGDGMSKIIYDLVELVWFAEWMKSGQNYQEIDDETEGYFNTEVIYVEYALHMDRYLESGEPKGDANIEGCIRLACLLFHNGTIWEFYPQLGPVFPKPISALRLALATTIPAGFFQMLPEVLIWVLFIGTWSSQLLPERTFFVTELAAAVRRQGIQSWQELRSLLLNFFYVDRIHQAALRGLWDEIQLIRIP
ncbi:hypothetical protein ANOM_009112 [Aspergillus nomiae NRRL 13137]|uniref:Uncharacterized protein n=1 Tax=Aspergillus nomiae NRRL (strain ATCC 15546 / NRRL 13137 / CBS 260.88 / M93) TaxID=1509407 RepID=A0A0L1IU14_ASPN3|nr:uncharacterized protein ANOM_009112 [Aspergillus nomiae NRRL 13137]KNG82982.1 hypothetical protein ANOM_009112 [Aspergillus nomiae NRRL 13137]